ncbi:MAG: tryptophan--tRNA ligase [Patescibacteria group bacterium]|jgi:tryptophanyl-tRNA synthetase
MTKRIFSGIQPSGNIHIGNYLGAIKQWIKLQNEVEELFFCVVDLHTITVPQDPAMLRKKILEVAAIYLASGIDSSKSSIFIQSKVPAHSELSWILSCQTYMGELNRMTQFKEKSKDSTSGVSAGLFNYPVLMAADILLYGTTHVPVGEDQVQHVELTRDIAQRFNNKYGQTFSIPELVIKKENSRIMSLDDPAKKMSKSSEITASYIALTDDAETIRQKIKRAVTDSGTEIKAGPDKLAINNLLNIFSGVTDKTVAEIESEFVGKGYGEFKEALAEAVVNFLEPIQYKYFEFMKDEEKLISILEEGAKKVTPIAQKTLDEVKSKIGLGY